MGLSRNTGWIVLVVGVVVLLATIFASDIGLGGTTFGLKHIVGLVVGIVLVAAGLYVALRPEPSGVK